MGHGCPDLFLPRAYFGTYGIGEPAVTALRYYGIEITIGAETPAVWNVYVYHTISKNEGGSKALGRPSDFTIRYLSEHQFRCAETAFLCERLHGIDAFHVVRNVIEIDAELDFRALIVDFP